MRKFLILFCIFLCLFCKCYSQRDSVHSLFNSSPHIHIPLKYSYVQWDLGYTNYIFNGVDLNGYSLNLVGIVFNNNIDIAVGLEGASNGFGYSGTNTVRSYSGLYLKLEPMLFSEKLINLSFPLKFEFSNLGFGNAGGYGRGRGRGRGGPGSSFYSFTPGCDVFLNVFHFLSIGGGINYRLAFSEPGSYPKSDYNNFSFSGIVRFKIYPNRKNKPQPDYYLPPQQRTY